MSAPVFLWDAAGPASESGGASTDRGEAQREAEECLRSGGAVTALVEEALVETGRMVAGARQTHYRRTGNAWQAQGGPQGITWVPVEAQAGLPCPR